MNAYDIILPKEVYVLVEYYMIINSKLEKTWAQYTDFCMGTNLLPKTSLIFPILFSELDFFETLLSRIQAHLPPEILYELQDDRSF
jgi:hypothetical protein